MTVDESPHENKHHDGPPASPGDPWIQMLGLTSFGNGATTEVLRQSEIAACYLAQIARHTCGTLNEAHWQTELQTQMRDDLDAVREILETAYPASALDRQRRDEAQRRLDECCPPEPPKPVCAPHHCPPDAEHGEAELGHGEAPGITVEGAPYEAWEPDGGESEERNAEHLPPTPPGPLRGSLAPQIPALGVREYTGGGAGGAGGANPVQFFVDTPLGSTVAFSGFPPDMSGASGSDVVLMSGNTWAAYSQDGGTTFTALNPSKIFPSGPTKDAAGNLLDNGLCCDQVIQYVPSIDRFIWLMQFCGSGKATGGTCLQGVNRLRIAAASPQAIKDSSGTAWTYWDLTSAGLNLGTTNAMDYPDLAVGTNSLYVSADQVGVGFVVVRIPLTQIQAGGGITFDYTNPATPSTGQAYGAHLSQITGDTVFWAGHTNTSTLQVFSMKEGENRYSWRGVDHDTYPNTDFTSFCPDNNDWLSFMAGFPKDGVVGATRVGNEVWFAWTAARGGGFAHPYVEVLQIDTATFKKTKQWQIWNGDNAFAYPSLTTNSAGEVGISLGWGGNNKYYADFAVGILGDFVVWYSQASDATDATNSAAGSNGRWGDFVTCRQAHPNTTLYSGAGYEVRKNTPPAAGTNFNPRYILFGRQSDAPTPTPGPH